MFRRILIANRGEIAVRVIRACRELGIESAAVFSDADAASPHVALADQAVRIGPPAPSESYLSIPALIAAARHVGADAVHPGYGFLSERPAFARACDEAGLVFIGPPAGVIERMGSKIAARALAAEAQVPVVPGETPTAQTVDAVAAAVRRIGLPALLKPSAGGGGIGMTALHEGGAIPESVERARREAERAFGDGTLYVERLVTHPRHVEIQVFADAHGQVLHLFERDCSLQRRHQKVVEESPSPAVTPALRARMGDAAVRLARAAGYRNAGTVEFLVEGRGDDAHFYFLEMNTRLQVEHPVTEEVVGVDLVRAQITVAAGEHLPWRQDDLSQRGHAIELRVYAEDPARGYLPQAGPLLLYREPRLPGVRIDSGVVEGGAVSVHYDPMIAKLIARGETREAAIGRARAAVDGYPILGVRTNLELLAAILRHPRFVEGTFDTAFLEEEAATLQRGLLGGPPPAAAAVAAVAGGAGSPVAPDGGPDPWVSLRRFRV